jgi:hypothetical protein
MSCASFQASETPFSTESVPHAGASNGARDSSRFALAVQRVENCLAAMQKINEQITGLAEQRRKVQDELRGIQCQMNEEFDRILKPARATNGAPGKVVARNVPCGAEIKPALRLDARTDSRLDLIEEANELAARAAS